MRSSGNPSANQKERKPQPAFHQICLILLVSSKRHQVFRSKKKKKEYYVDILYFGYSICYISADATYWFYSLHEGMQVTNSKPISSRLAFVYTHLWYPWSGKGSTFIHFFYPKIFQCDHHENVKNTIQRTGGRSMQSRLSVFPLQRRVCRRGLSVEVHLDWQGTRSLSHLS